MLTVHSCLIEGLLVCIIRQRVLPGIPSPLVLLSKKKQSRQFDCLQSVLYDEIYGR